MHVSVKLAVAAVALVSASAFAQDVEAEAPVVSRGQGWSAHSGQTVGDGGNVIVGEIGWPGISATFLHGATDKFDIGVRLTPLAYGFEGRVRQTNLGIKLQGVAKINFLERGRLNFGAEFAPGPMFYFDRDGTAVGLALPVDFKAGLAVGSAIMINFGMSLPMFVMFRSSITRDIWGGFYLPILFGGGAEYFIDRRLAVSFNMKMGPSIHMPTGRAEFAMNAMLGVAYKF